MSVDVLEQIVREDKYARENIRANVRKELAESDLDDAINVAVKAIEKYLSGTYYKRKQEYVDHVRALDLDLSELVIDILIIIAPSQGNYLTIQSVATQLSKQFKIDDIFTAVEVASEIITVACECDLYDVIKPDASVTGSILIQSNMEFDQKFKEYLAGTKYLPPMVCKPSKVMFPTHSGLKSILKPVMLKGKKPAGKLPYDVINIRNGIALSLDERMLEIEETPKKPLDTPEKIAAFNQMKAESKEVYEDLLNHGNKFYFTHRLDERYRMYCQGYHCSYQSSEYKKSIINFNKKVLIQ